MIDLWKYEYCGKVKIVDNAGNTFIGMAQEVTDEEDRSDEERKEMGITIECDGALIEFYQSDIKSIEKCGEGA
jgi:hypothetical protein|nr:MAG TPA: hypothetical protein [Caudoviricetes sp.]DAV00752.1 MAG TPA: hypothetical protein [Caudoviricetes sp.]